MPHQYRLAYHIMAPRGWMNDPNGLIEYKGEYHVFYQYHPHSAEWGPMHWGHVKSSDLVHWTHLPIALYPDSPSDIDGCFSGSAVEQDDQLMLLYTGNRDSVSPKQVQCLAQSADGVHFSKYIENPVIAGPPPDACEDFRDPKVWRHEDLWYMVVGSGSEGLGKVLLYSSKNLLDWCYLGIAAQSDGRQGVMFECPDLFSLDGKHVLICSPISSPGHKAIYILGDMDYNNGQFFQEFWCEIDHGPDFYAPQTFLDSKGRRIMLGWMSMWGRDVPTQKYGWAGALTIPRELRLVNGRLTQHPVPELSSLRRTCLANGSIQTPIYGDCLEIRISLSIAISENTKEPLGISVRHSDDMTERTDIFWDVASGELVVDCSKSGLQKGTQTRVGISNSDALKMDMTIYVDRSSVEVFADDGLIALSFRIYPKSSSLGVSRIGTGIECLHAWELESIWV